MHRIAKFTALGLCTIVWSVCGSPSQADLVNWNIDASQSFIQLSIPQQSVTTTSGTFDIRIRNQTGSSSVWNVGNKAFLDGTLTTSYALGDTDIRIIGGQSTIQGLNSGSFDPLSSPAGAGDAPAVYGGKAQGDLPIFGWDDVAFVALRNVLFDAATTTALPISAGNFDSTAVQIGVAGGEAAYRGVGLAGGSIGSGVEVFPPFLAANTAAGGMITTPNPMIPAQQRLTVSVNIPVTLDLGGGGVTGTATGTIVANAVVPAANDRIAAGNIAVLGPADPFDQYQRRGQCTADRLTRGERAAVQCRRLPDRRRGRGPGIQRRRAVGVGPTESARRHPSQRRSRPQQLLGRLALGGQQRCKFRCKFAVKPQCRPHAFEDRRICQPAHVASGDNPLNVPPQQSLIRHDRVEL